MTLAQGPPPVRMRNNRTLWRWILAPFLLATVLFTQDAQAQSCQFYPLGENRRFERVSENIQVGQEVFRVEVHPRRELRVEAMDNSLSDINYFRHEDIDDRTVSIKVSKSLEDLVDRPDPQSVLKFKLTCRGASGTEEAFLPVTVYIQDVNDHAPEFQNVPYHLEVDELTPVGLTVFRGVHAIDRDKPNTPNSDVTYAIVGGNENNSFALSDPLEGIIVINKPLDFDHGPREYRLEIQARDHGSPESFQSLTSVTIRVKDADDQNPVFTRQVYKTNVTEAAVITGARLRVKLQTDAPVHAFDQDLGINAPLRYSIIHGNELGIFELQEQTAELFMVREVDLESLPSPVFTLQVQHPGTPRFVWEPTSPMPQNATLINFEGTSGVSYRMQIGGITHAKTNYKHGEFIMHSFEVLLNELGEKEGENLRKLLLNAINSRFLPQATQMDNSLRYALAKVEVSVMDINDNVPVFDYDMYNITVMENLPPGFTVVQVHAVDRDSGDNADFLYHLIDDTGGFTIDEKEGWIRVRDPAKLDREKVDKLTMRVLALERKPNVNPDAKASTAVVEVSLLDANDNNPQFLPEGVYIFSVTETDPPGTVIGSVVAVDPDMGENGRVVFFKQNDTLSYSVPFGVHPFNGSVYVLDRFKDIPVKPDRYTFFVVASDAARSEHERRTAVAVVHVNVTDVNNNVPEFVGAPYEAQVGESLPAGALVTQVSAKDLDANTALTYSIIAGNDDETFHMNPFTGVITSGTVLDFEKKQSYDLLVQVSDGFNTAVSPLTVHVVDINDQQPVFTHNYYNFSVVEEMTENVTVGTIRAIDRDSGRNAAIRYTILGDHANNALLVDEGGNIVTKRSLDRERESKLEFLVIAFDGGIPQLSGTTTVAVQVEDINDNPPYFEGDTFFVNVPEEKDPPLEVFTLQAKDVDSGDNAVMKYRIIGGNDDAVFGMNEDTGVVTTSKRLNYETQAEYALQVAAFNVRPFQGPQAATMGNPVVNLIVRVQDVNDELVTFEQTSYNFRIWENTTRSESVGFLNATNQHQTSGSQHVTFWIGEGNDLGKFWINPSTGELVLMDKVDRDPPDSQVQFRLKVFARDLQSITPYNTSVPVIIDVLDINDNAPSFGEEKFALELPESLPLGTELPAFYRARDIDAGPNGQIVRFMTEGAEDKFFVNNVTGALTLISELDYETADTHEFVVLAMDGGTPPKTGSASIIISVQNINEFSPEFVGYPYNFYVAENAARGTSVGQIQATDKDGNKIVYAISDGDVEYFGIESDTGKLYVKKNLESRTSYTIVVTATDNGVPENRTLGVQVTVFVKEVNNYPPVFSHSSYKGTVLEKYATDRVIIKLFATDKDLQNNTITYNITSGNDEGIFVIDHETGDIRVNPETINLLDYDRKKQFVMLVQAKDSHNTPLFGLSMVTIDVLDSNDHAPTFSKTAYSASLPENLPSGHCFLSIQANSGDSVDQVTYEILNKDIPFTVNGRSGDVCTSQVLDRERRDSYEFAVAASDGKFDMKAPVSIEVVDENDNPPRFEKERYSVSIPHDSQAGRSVIQLHAIDLDVANNGEITYWIKNTHGIFEIDAKTGLVRMAAGLPLNSMKNLTYEMEVFAQDHGAASNIGKTSLVVKVSSTHNNPPVFDRFAYSVYVDENAANVPLVQVHASDPDEGSAGKVVYRIARATKRETFRIDSQTGKITLVSPLDYEQIKHLEVFVEARDDANEPQFATTIVQVTVNDVNDNAPEFLSMPRLLRIPESTSQNELVYRVQAIDLDSPAGGNNDIKFELNPPSTRFSIHPKTGQVFATQPLQLGTEALRIVATDGSIYPLTSAVEMRIEVYKDSVDEPSPAFSSVQYTVDSASVIEAGATVLEARATVPNGSPIWYNITGDDGSHVRRFSINHDSGRIVTTTRLDAEKQSVYHFMVVAVNKRDPQHQAEAGVVIRLTDKNVRCPKFPFTEYFASIQENSPPDTVVLPNLIAEDVEKFEKISYQITEDNSDDNFVLDTKQNVISLRVKKPLDRDNMPAILQGVYTLTVTASNYKCSGSSRIKVYVEDVNDNSPVFEKNDYVVELEENTPPGQTVTHLMAADRDGLDLGKIRYYIIDGNSGEEFSMDETSGIISVRLIPDREKTPAFMLKVLAVDSANNTGRASVHIIIKDTNDWTPTFLNDTFFLNVTEGPPSIGAFVQLPVADYDDGINRQVELYIVDGNNENQFRLGVNENGAVLKVVSELDRDKYKVPDAALHLVVVAARDMGTPSRTGSTTVAIVIQDVNDSPPQFEKEAYYEFVSENAPVGTIVDTVKATDPDSPQNTNMTYSFARLSRRVPFMIDPILGTVNITRALDISESQEYSLEVQANDGLWKTTTAMKIYVSEAEERDPRFDQLHYKFKVLENVPGAVVGQVELQSRTLRVNSQMRYSIINTDVRPFFNITKDGEIFTKVGLDREKRSRYTFTVMLEEKRPTTKVSVSEVSVEVVDVNDETPTFMQSYQGTIRENSPPGTLVTVTPSIMAIDKDSGNNSVVHYSLGGSGSDLFSILDSGVVIFSGGNPVSVLDRELADRYELLVTARDLGNLSSTTYLTIKVEDENDNAPSFQHGPLRVLLPETARPGARVAQVSAIDADEKGPNSKVEYSIVSGSRGNVRIDRQTGEIFVVGALKPETVYLLNVSAADGRGLANLIVVNITVLDVNDHKPTFVKPEYSFTILEGNYKEQRSRLGVLRAVDDDRGKNGAVDYAIISRKDQNLPFHVDVHTGELFATGVLDRETKFNYYFHVLALDNGDPPQNSTVNVTVTIDDANDEKPRFFTDPYLAQIPENLDPGQKVTQIRAFDPDTGENGLVFYKLGGGHDNKFYIDSKDGTVWTLSKLDFEKQEFYNMTVIAYDQGKPSMSAMAKLWVTVTDRNDVVPEFPKSVYTLEVAENTRVGDVVYTLDAGPGNFLYTLDNPQEVDTFSVEPHNGEIRLAKALDSIHQSHYRLVVSATDDGDPPKSDHAEVNIIIGSGQGVRLFPLRMYDVLVFENQLAPQVVLDLNATDEIAHRPVQYTIVGNNYNGLFAIEPDTGRLSVTSSLDREAMSKYVVKVRAMNKKRVGRAVRDNAAKRNKKPEEDTAHVAFDEALVVVNVGDENDNSPVFDHQGKPIVAAVPLEASFGYQVTKLHARDADTGFNGAIRYEIIQKAEDASSKFQIDPVTGVVRSVVTFSLDGGKMYGFDVKAVDREGSEGGNAAVANVFVYVLPETKLVLFVTDTPPVHVEQHIDRILGYLGNITGFQVKMAKLEPHHEDEMEHPESSDLFLYAINKDTNEIVDTDTLLNVLNENSQVIVRYLETFRIRRIQGVSVQEKISQMGTTEIAIIALSSVIFLGAVLGIVLLCSSCQRKKLRKRQKTWEQQRLYSIKNPLMGKAVGNPYGGRVSAGPPPIGVPPPNLQYNNVDDVPMDYNDSMTDTYSVNKHNKMKLRQTAPDGASSLNPPRSPRFERYAKNENGWYDNRDVETVKSDMTGSNFTSWSSRRSHQSQSRGKPVTEL